MEVHPKLRPVDTATDCVYLTGYCEGLKDIPDTNAQAKAAAPTPPLPTAARRRTSLADGGSSGRPGR